MSLEKLARTAEGMKYSLMRNDAAKEAQMASEKQNISDAVARLIGG